MIALVRSELYRMATIRSSWLSVALFGFSAAAFGVLNPYAWSLFAGIGAFGISVLGVTQPFQHRTVALLYLARPKRLPVLLALVVTAVAVAWAMAALSGVTVLAKGGHAAYDHTLAVVPIMAVFGAALASIVRRSSWLLIGFAVWFIVVEILLGKLEWQLPVSAYLAASSARGDVFSREIFIVWTVSVLAVATVTLRRDTTTD
jgi:hypothetical protein